MLSVLIHFGDWYLVMMLWTCVCDEKITITSVLPSVIDIKH